MPPNSIHVVDVQAGGWADKNGVRNGDLLLELNGRPIGDWHAKEFTDALAARPARLTFLSDDGENGAKKGNSAPMLVASTAQPPGGWESTRLHGWSGDWAAQPGSGWAPVAQQPVGRMLGKASDDADADVSADDLDFLVRRVTNRIDGEWSGDDVVEALGLLDARDGRVPFPMSFADEAERRVRYFVQASDDPPSVALRPALGEFASRRQYYFQLWAHDRARSVYACPHCAKCFSIRQDGAGHEVAVIARKGDAIPESAYKLLPSGSSIDELHAQAIAAVAADACVLGLPAGAGRPAIHGKILLEFSTRGGFPFGAIFFLASDVEQRFTESCLRGLVAGQFPQVRRLRSDERLRKLDGIGVAVNGYRQIIFCTPTMFTSLVRANGLCIKDVGFVVISGNADETPPVRDASVLARL